MNLHPKITHYSHLIFQQVIDLNNNQVFITPKSHVTNMTFRRPNCSCTEEHYD